MAANIFGSRFVGARTPAWHALGKVIPADQQISVEDALQVGGIDFLYHRCPIGVQLPDGTVHEGSSSQAVMREPTTDDPVWCKLGIVSENYRFLQNADLARGLDAIAQTTGWQFETVGALGYGETVFMTLRTGQRSIFGDKLDTYLIVSDGKAAQRALQIAVAPVRVVCQNTLLMSDSAAAVKITIAHDQDVESEYGFWLGLIQQLQAAQDAAYAQLEQMGSVKISDKQAKSLIASALPLPGKSARTLQVEQLVKLSELSAEQSAAIQQRAGKAQEHHDWWKAKTAERRDAAFTLYQRFNAGDEEGAKGGRVVDPETLATLSNTPYAVVQAVTELVDWCGAGSASRAAENALFGNGADVKQRIWGVALKLATA